MPTYRFASVRSFQNTGLGDCIRQPFNYLPLHRLGGCIFMLLLECHIGYNNAYEEMKKSLFKK